MSKAPHEPTPDQVHQLEQHYARANQIVDSMIDATTHDTPLLKANMGLSDGSVVFGYIFTHLTAGLMRGATDQQMIIAVAAAALTRLARASRADDELLAQLDKEIQGNDEH